MILKMLKGLPASGKTTKARELVKESGSAGRINRDDLRAMLFDSVWTGKREGVVIDCEKAIAEVLLKHGQTPIIDDTNLLPKHRDLWSRFAQEKGVAFGTVDLSGTSPEECCLRDCSRGRPVGRAVIWRMALQAGLIPWSDLPIILCDIDGTLANGEHREHHLKGEKKDWKSYYAELSGDSPIDLVVRWVRELSQDHTICLVSGRPDTYQRETLVWLIDNGIPYDYLFMRSGGDKRPDTEVKKQILDGLPKEKIKFVIDDRPRVIRMWRENGLTVYPVRGACEDF